GRRMAAASAAAGAVSAGGGGSTAGGAPGDRALREGVALGFRLLLARPPREEELARLAQLHREVRERLAAEKDRAARLATAPLGPVRAGADPVDLAAWTVVGNVLLNLDETLMKR